LFSWLALATACVAAEGKRQAMPIGGEWNLSGKTLERAKMEGKRVVQLIAKGDARLKKGRKPLMGPWTLEASAEVIECDFPGKRFIIRGPYTLTKKESGGKTEISGPGADSTAELPFQGGAIRTEGPSKTKVDDGAMKDDGAPQPAERPAEAGK
jgi:hypothetical protein